MKKWKYRLTINNEVVDKGETNSINKTIYEITFLKGYKILPNLLNAIDFETQHISEFESELDGLRITANCYETLQFVFKENKGWREFSQTKKKVVC